MSTRIYQPRPSNTRQYRSVWAAITANPRITMRQLAKECDISLAQTRYYVRTLERLGYITPTGPHKGGTRRVLIGLYPLA